MKGEGDEFGQVARNGTGRGNGLSAEDIRPMLSLIATPVKAGWLLKKGFAVAELYEPHSIVMCYR
jgi:hypothetical protein